MVSGRCCICSIEDWERPSFDEDGLVFHEDCMAFRLSQGRMGVTRLGRQWFSSVPRGVRSKDRKRGPGGSRQGVRDDRHGRLYDRRTISLSRARMGKS